jgi:oxygen-independent coproporphyrinogen-3 oxidase
MQNEKTRHPPTAEGLGRRSLLKSAAKEREHRCGRDDHTPMRRTRIPDPGPRTTGRGAGGLYIHLPFCASRCAYCTFVTSTEIGLMPRTLEAVCRELDLLGRRARRPLETLYLGGGTPSLVPGALLERMFRVLDLHFPRVRGAEVTLEANPDDVTGERAATWARLGVTRVSVGVQAFADPVLEMLNRRHTAAQARDAVAVLQKAGFSVSVDLMLGLPRMTPAQLDETVAEVLRLRPGHISVYLLETDKPHALARLAARRPDLFPNADAAARQYLAAGGALVRAGYRHYEISNFALPGKEARHNVRYWRRLPVLSAGVAAHGHSRRRRWAAPDDLPAYLSAVEGGRLPRAWSRRLDREEVLKEHVMLGLRLAHGVRCDAVELCSRAAPAFRETMDDFLSLGYARRTGDRIRLTPRGWLVSNELFATLW